MVQIVTMNELLYNRNIEGWVIVNLQKGLAYGYNTEHTNGYFIRVLPNGKFKVYERIQKDDEGEDLLHKMGGLSYVGIEEGYNTFQEAMEVVDKEIERKKKEETV